VKGPIVSSNLDHFQQRISKHKKGANRTKLFERK
jgi:hypothetical protein